MKSGIQNLVDEIVWATVNKNQKSSKGKQLFEAMTLTDLSERLDNLETNKDSFSTVEYKKEEEYLCRRIKEVGGLKNERSNNSNDMWNRSI